MSYGSYGDWPGARQCVGVLDSLIWPGARQCVGVLGSLSIQSN